MRSIAVAPMPSQISVRNFEVELMVIVEPASSPVSVSWSSSVAVISTGPLPQSTVEPLPS